MMNRPISKFYPFKVFSQQTETTHIKSYVKILTKQRIKEWTSLLIHEHSKHCLFVQKVLFPFSISGFIIIVIQGSESSIVYIFRAIYHFSISGQISRRLLNQLKWAFKLLCLLWCESKNIFQEWISSYDLS